MIIFRPSAIRASTSFREIEESFEDLLEAFGDIVGDNEVLQCFDSKLTSLEEEFFEEDDHSRFEMSFIDSKRCCLGMCPGIGNLLRRHLRVSQWAYLSGGHFGGR